MGKKDEKTNVCRILDEKGIQYEYFSPGDITNAVSLAQALGVPFERVFKTLVTVAKSGEHYVFMIPAGCELDLKKAAKTVGEKSVDMLPQKQLLGLTGYVHGGCSPIGMKKQFKTFINISALDEDEIYFSAGKIGHQIKMSAGVFCEAFGIIPSDVIKQQYYI